MNMKKITFTLLGFMLMGAAFASDAGATYPNEKFTPDIQNKESLQRGARYFMNFCSGCHGLSYQRYNRTFKDLGIDLKVGKDTLIFTGATEFDHMNSAMPRAEAGKWLGTAPPDLSLTARAKTGQYIYNYLLGFYIDESRPLGFNNSVFPNASMPNPLWTFQGLQEPIYEKQSHCVKGECTETEALTGFKLVRKGSMNSEEYKQVAYDLANFLTYVSDPTALNRAALGPWVLLFIALLTIVLYFLKREYWRDIH